MQQPATITAPEFRALVKAAGLTQAEAAKLLGLSLSSIEKRCNGALAPRNSEVLALRAMQA